MAYLLDTFDFSDYGIEPGHAPNSNIALSGHCDMPSRIGVTERDWGEWDGVEPYVDADEIFYGGRDITFYGFIIGTEQEVFDNLTNFRNDIDWTSALRVLSTPYGSYSVQMKSIVPGYLRGGATVTIVFREPVPDLTGGELPATGTDDYTIDSIPMKSFGLYVSKKDKMANAPDLKPMRFTQYGSEGYQIVPRQTSSLEFNGAIIGNTLALFQANIKALYKLFSSPGLRTVKLNGVDLGSFYMTEGFKVTGIYKINE